MYSGCHCHVVFYMCTLHTCTIEVHTCTIKARTTIIAARTSLHVVTVFALGSKAGPSVVSVAPQTCRHDLFRPHPSDRVVRPRPSGSAPHTQGYCGDGSVSPGGNRMLRDGVRALRLEQDRPPRVLSNGVHLREGRKVSQVDPAMPSDSNQARKRFSRMW